MGLICLSLDLHVQWFTLVHEDAVQVRVAEVGAGVVDEMEHGNDGAEGLDTQWCVLNLQLGDLWLDLHLPAACCTCSKQ